MAAPLDAPMPPEMDLGPGFTIRVTGLATSDGSVVSGINVSKFGIEYDGSSTIPAGQPTPTPTPTPSPPPPTPVPSPTVAVVLGSSAVPTGTTYAEQITAEHVKATYFYGQAAPTWSQVVSMGVPNGHALAFQTKATTRSGYDATLSTFPAARSAPVYLHYQNEIDRHVHLGDLTLADAQARTDELYAAIAAADKTYVQPALGIQYWALHNYLNGHLGANKEWDVPAYLRTGLKTILFSVYAGTGGPIVNGHVVAAFQPAKMAADIDGFLDQHPGVTWQAVLCFPIPIGYLTDATSLQNRVTWLQESYDAYTAMRHPPEHLLWFDFNQAGQGDERLAEPKLHAEWLKLTDGTTPTPTPTPTPAPTPSPTPVPVGAMIFSDEFNGAKGSKPSSALWRVKTSKAGNGIGYWDGWNQLSLDGNGNLVVTATKRADGLWNCGIISSIHEYKGARYIEARARMAGGTGTWNAPVWEWAAPYGAGPLENDVNEQLGRQPDAYHFTLHNWTTKAEATFQVDTGVNLAAAFHVYGCALYPDHADVYFDGVKKTTIKASQIGMSDLTSYLEVVNVNLNMGGWGGTPTIAGPVSMLVDYVRVHALA